MPATLQKETLAFWLQQACALMSYASALIRNAFDKEFTYQRKADQSWVTEIDFEIERVMRSRLAKTFPEHGIVGEEFADQNRWAEFTWVIDPIDGTSSLRHRIPLFGTILALLHQQTPVLGVIDLPMLNRTYSGGAGLGVWCNGRQLRIAEVAPDFVSTPDFSALLNSTEVVAMGGRNQFLSAGVPQIWDTLIKLHGPVRLFGDCFAHALALEGSVGAMLDFDLRLWDIAATQVLIPEAGGKFVCVGQRGTGLDARYDVVFGKPAVVDWILRTLQLSDSSF